MCTHITLILVEGMTALLIIAVNRKKTGPLGVVLAMLEANATKMATIGPCPAITQIPYAIHALLIHTTPGHRNNIKIPV
jgi:hypothetical protein